MKKIDYITFSNSARMSFLRPYSRFERGILTDLECFSMENEGYLPKLEDIAFLVGLTDDEWLKYSKNILRFVKKDENGMFFSFYKDAYDLALKNYLSRCRGVPFNGDRYVPSDWNIIREFVFERDNFTCTYCGEQSKKLECDHIHPVSRGGDNSLTNLTTACITCNRSKGAKLLEDWVSQ
jgi:hypothetical protein